jgi:hypothetical protein
MGVFFIKEDCGKYWHYKPRINFVISQPPAFLLALGLTLAFVLSFFLRSITLAYFFAAAILAIVAVATIYWVEVLFYLGSRDISHMIPDSAVINILPIDIIDIPPFGVGFKLKK